MRGPFRLLATLGKGPLRGPRPPGRLQCRRLESFLRNQVQVPGRRWPRALERRGRHRDGLLHKQCITGAMEVNLVIFVFALNGIPRPSLKNGLELHERGLQNRLPSLTFQPFLNVNVNLAI